jgi:triphosphoribosyl-dephospho-CoA synthase
MPVLWPAASYTMPRMEVKQVRRRSPGPGAGTCWSAEAVAGAAQLACVLEASAEKPGNITPLHDFADTSYEDMLRSAIALGPELGRAAERGVGETVLAAVRATQRVAGANTNLGIALLLAPLARGALRGGTLRERTQEVLGELTLDDARAAYAAIRTAGAGGLDEPVEHDVHQEPTIALGDAMAAAAGRDSVAAEYASGYALTFDLGLPALAGALDAGLGPRAATVELFLGLLAAVPDTLIARKRGLEAAERVSAGAARVLAGQEAVEAFDASLREDGNALNPGTTADLVTACLFVALRERTLTEESPF